MTDPTDAAAIAYAAARRELAFLAWFIAALSQARRRHRRRRRPFGLMGIIAALANLEGAP